MKLDTIQTIKADTLDARGSADIHISPDGNFVYASNRLKGDGIAIFSVNSEDGTLEKAGYQLREFIRATLPLRLMASICWWLAGYE